MLFEDEKENEEEGEFVWEAEGLPEKETERVVVPEWLHDKVELSDVVRVMDSETDGDTLSLPLKLNVLEILWVGVNVKEGEEEIEELQVWEGVTLQESEKDGDRLSLKVWLKEKLFDREMENVDDELWDDVDENEIVNEEVIVGINDEVFVCVAVEEDE